MAAKGKIRIEGDAASVAAMWKEIQKGSSTTSKTVNRNTKSMSQEIDHFSNNIQKAAQVFKTMANKAKELEKVKLQMTILEKSNKGVYDQLMKTQQASFGLANSFDMVGSANKALAFGIDLSNGKFEKLVGLTTKVASVIGTDAKQAFDDLIVGIARGSKPILDNLGVMVDITQINKDYASQLGITVQQLTAQQKQTALTEETIRQLSITTEDVTEKMIVSNSRATKGLKRLETTWNNATTAALTYYETVASNMEKVGAWYYELTHDNTSDKRHAKMLANMTKEHRTRLKLLQSYSKLAGQVGTVVDKQYKKIRRNLKKEALIKRRAANAEAKEKKKAAEKAAKIQAQLRKKEIDAIIKFEKELMGYQDLSNFDKIQADKALAKLRLGLLEETNIKALQATKEDTAKEVDILDAANKKKEDLLEKEKKAKEDALREKKRIAKEEQALWDRQTKRMLKEYAKRKKEEESFETKKLAIIKKFQDMKENLLMSGIEASITAVLDGNAKGLPLILAQIAQSEGTQMFMHGLKVWWKGIGDTSTGNPLGPVETATGAKEMLAGGTLAAGGALGAKFLSGGSGGTGGSTAKAEGSTERVNTRNAIDNTKQTEPVVNVYQYPSPKEQLERLQNQIKKSNSSRNGRN